MSKRNPYRDDDILGRYPPAEMENPGEHLLSDAEFERAWREQNQTIDPDKWFGAERRIRSDRVARTLLMSRGGDEGDGRAAADVPDIVDVAIQLLGDALPHLPEKLAEEVRQFLEQ